MTPMAEIEAKYKILAKGAHPDQGGDHSQMARLNDAREKALRERA